MHRSDYRPFVPAPGMSRIAGATAAEHTSEVTKRERARLLLAGWADLARQPFTGVTTDGRVRRGLFSLRPEGAPAERMAAAAAALLARLTPERRRRMHFAVDSERWRSWQNTELLLETHGLRLDQAEPGLREAVVSVLEASLSPRGLEKSRAVMRLNGFLGDLLGAGGVLGEWSYTFCLFGTPAVSGPWGWQLFGHHLSLNCMAVGGQVVFTPCFLGAEPTYADHGRFGNISLFEDEERGGLELMRSLSPGERGRAIVSGSMDGDDHPPGRWHFADHLHLGGAHQDNRIVPYEGLPCDGLTASRRRALLDLVATYVEMLPPGPRAARMEDVERHLADTRFCWIGGTGEASAFYYRIQSPVVFIEFDQHTGVFLDNPEPANFHVHTIVRTPNGNDYGIDLLRLHYARSDHHGPGPARPRPAGGA